MNKQAAMSIISTKIGKRDHLIDNGTIPNEMLLAQTYLEESAFLPWFLIQRFQPELVSGTQNVPLPTGFIRLDEEHQTQLKHSGVNRPIYIATEEELTEEYPSGVLGLPLYFYLDTTDLWLYPTPNAQYTYNLNYKAYVADTSILSLADTETNLWLTHAATLVITRTAMVLAKNLQNPKLAQALQAEYLEAKQELIGSDTARRVAGRQIMKRG